MDAIKSLIHDHEEVASMFSKFEALTDETDRAVAAEKICHALSVHTIIEEEIFYPDARRIIDRINPDMLDEAIDEHQEAKSLIAEIKTMVTGEDLTIIMKELKAVIERHVEEEEDEMFPLLRKMGMETTKLGIEMSRRKLELKSTVK